jgi:hypothetical protein
MSGVCDNIKGYSLREYSPMQRCEIIEHAFKIYCDKIAFCVIDGIADLRDESDRDGIRVVIELKRDAVPAVVQVRKNDVPVHIRRLHVHMKMMHGLFEKTDAKGCFFMT